MSSQARKELMSVIGRVSLNCPGATWYLLRSSYERQVRDKVGKFYSVGENELETALGYPYWGSKQIQVFEVMERFIGSFSRQKPPFLFHL